MEELCGMHGGEMQDLHGVVPLLKEKRNKLKRFGTEVHLVSERGKSGGFKSRRNKAISYFL